MSVRIINTVHLAEDGYRSHSQPQSATVETSELLRIVRPRGRAQPTAQQTRRRAYDTRAHPDPGRLRRLLRSMLRSVALCRHWNKRRFAVPAQCERNATALTSGPGLARNGTRSTQSRHMLPADDIQPAERKCGVARQWRVCPSMPSCPGPVTQVRVLQAHTHPHPDHSPAAFSADRACAHRVTASSKCGGGGEGAAASCSEHCAARRTRTGKMLSDQ